jgi:hypothetical protein
MKNAAESHMCGLPTARRSVELCVLPKTVEGNDVVEFSVMDHHLGISCPEVMDRLYEAFTHQG